MNLFKDGCASKEILYHTDVMNGKTSNEMVLLLLMNGKTSNEMVVLLLMNGKTCSEMVLLLLMNGTEDK